MKDTLLYSPAEPFTGFQCLLVVALAVLAVVAVPLTLAIAGSLTAFCAYSLCARTFRKVEGSASPLPKGPKNWSEEENPR